MDVLQVISGHLDRVPPPNLPPRRKRVSEDPPSAEACWRGPPPRRKRAGEEPPAAETCWRGPPLSGSVLARNPAGDGINLHHQPVQGTEIGIELLIEQCHLDLPSLFVAVAFADTGSDLVVVG